MKLLEVQTWVANPPKGSVRPAAIAAAVGLAGSNSKGAAAPALRSLPCPVEPLWPGSLLYLLGRRRRSSSSFLFPQNCLLRPLFRLLNAAVLGWGEFLPPLSIPPVQVPALRRPKHHPQRLETKDLLRLAYEILRVFPSGPTSALDQRIRFTRTSQTTARLH